MNNLGDFEVIFPLAQGVSSEQDELMTRYNLIMARAKEMWEDSIQGGGHLAKKKEA